jgi:hypothetical protein
MAVRNKLYYPQSQIVTNLHTSGKEWMTESGEEYVGYYHKYIDGKVASGAVYVKGQSVTLIKYIDHAVQPDNALYNSLIKKKFTPISPKQTIPIPVVDDYQVGKFTRYFLRRRNYSTYEDIIEVNEAQFKLWKRTGSGIDQSLYQGLELEWKLTGPLNDNTTTINTEYGVYDTNERLVLLKDYEMTGLKNFLTDYIELSIYSPYVSNSIKNIFGYVK